MGAGDTLMGILAGQAAADMGRAASQSHSSGRQVAVDSGNLQYMVELTEGMHRSMTRLFQGQYVHTAELQRQLADKDRIIEEQAQTIEDMNVRYQNLAERFGEERGRRIGNYRSKEAYRSIAQKATGKSFDELDAEKDQIKDSPEIQSKVDDVERGLEAEDAKLGLNWK